MKLLYRGFKGPQIQGLKALLSKHGYKMSSRNTFDLATEAAVRDFQEATHLEKDGLVGSVTMRELQVTDPLYGHPISPIKWVRQTSYFDQRDNHYNPAGTCNVTSLAMVLDFHGVRPTVAKQLEDELFLRLQERDAKAFFAKHYPWAVKQGYKPRHVHGMLGWLAKEYAFDWDFSDNFSWSEMSSFGPVTGPMIISGTFTRAGHIICLTGMTISDDMIVHDPWGNWERGYGKDRNGKFLIYNRENMEQILSGNSSTQKRVHRIKPQ